jgi:glycosyltransferase involved in cell wall biosynthesis
MKILIVHNFYGNYATGGEANVFYNEVRMLREHGHEVYTYEVTNQELFEFNFFEKIKFFFNPGWSKKSYKKFSLKLDEIKPDIVHFHNYKYVLSPSVIKAAKDKNIPTVLTIHNYRMLCPAGSFLRNNKPCELCFQKGFPERMFIHLCSNNRLKDTYFMYRLYKTLQRHKWLSNYVDSYIVLSEFAKEKYLKLGLPQEHVFVKPNFIRKDISLSPFNIPFEQFVIYIGRLSVEKGIHLITPRWSKDFPPLVIVGEGPLYKEMKATAPANVYFTGNLSHEQAMYLLSKSMFLIFPSVWYEGMPLVIIEAMYLSKAILASNLGPRKEMITHNINGLLYDISKKGDFEEKVKYMLAEERYKILGKNANKIVNEKYTELENYKQLIYIYEKTISRKK